jgi:hypothetical protein
VFDQRLIKKINAGDSFALIGAGASAEMGYPSWTTLAGEVLATLKRQKRVTDEAAYEKYLKDNRLPEFFSQAERDLGSRYELISLVSSLLKPKAGSTHHVYDMLASWPFACYLTTNWDDEINERLKANRTFFKTIQNTKPEFSLLRHNAANLIVKLHSDLQHPDLAVITSSDYNRLLLPEFAYFRDRIKAVFEMFDVLIIGHSLSDPDIQQILTIAKDTASPQHPVFMIAPDLTKAEQAELLEQYNIVAASYDNSDKRHIHLRRTLALMNRFIIPRKQRVDLGGVHYTADELEAVQSIAVYRRFATMSQAELQPISYLGPLVLAALRQAKGLVNEDDLQALSPLSSATTTAAVKALVPFVLAELEKAGKVERESGAIRLSNQGIGDVDALFNKRTLEEEQAYGQFLVEIESQTSGLTADKQKELCDKLRDTLVTVFKQRGLSMANVVFSGRSLDHDALSDVFNAICETAGTVGSRELGLAFMEAAHSFLLKPTEPQKKYLASISQGFFLYHLFGLDPNCTKIRRDVFQGTIWWCDSSTILPLVAIGSENHDYAKDLFGRLQTLDANTLTTERLLKETVQHLAWAQAFLERESVGSQAVLEAATSTAGYQQNLFLDGYIRLSAEGKVNKFTEYVNMVAPFGTAVDDMRRQIDQMGIKVVSITDMEGFQDGDTREVFELSHEILEARTKSSTYRSDKQVEAEAEILLMIRKLQDKTYKPPAANMTFERSYFLSQSRVLDRIPPTEPVSWTPEALYRYILALPGELLDPDLLQRCMLQEYFATGVVVVDTPRYEKFFGPSINIANTTYSAERDQYLMEFQDLNGAALDKAFESTPDLEKPFFAQQMGWKLAREERLKKEAAEHRAKFEHQQAVSVAAELVRVKQGRDEESKKKEEARKRQLEAERRNSQDEKHLRKRQRQAKSRKKKKKK